MARSDLQDPAYGDLVDELLALEPHALNAIIDHARPEDARLIERVLASQLNIGWRADPAQMMFHFNPSWTVYRYQQFLGEKFRQLVTGEDPYQIWNVPARYGKSALASQWGPAWVLDRTEGRARIILTSYGDTLVAENADAVREILRDHPDELNVELRRDKARVRRFATPQGGGILAAAIGAGITGFGAGAGGGVVIDDPFKNWQEAHSDATRERVWNEYRSVLRLRLDPSPEGEPPPWILIVHTRWHEDDLTGRLSQQAHDGVDDGVKFTIIRLPAIAEAPEPNALDPILRMPDPLGRAPGETLGRFPEQEVRDRAAELGSYLAAGLEQQRPAPVEGGELKRAWWHWVDELPAKCDAWASSWDMKLKDNETGDYVVGQVWGRVAGDFYLYAQLRGQWNQATTRAAMALVVVRFPQVRRHLVENAGFGPEVMTNLRKGTKGYDLSDDIVGQLGITIDERPKVQAILRRGLSGLVPVTPIGKKPVRVRAVSPILEAGNVHLRTGDRGALQLVNEAAGFPGAHDDAVDAWSQAMSKMSQGVGRISRPGASKQAAPTPDPKGPAKAPAKKKRTGQVATAKRAPQRPKAAPAGRGIRRPTPRG